VLTPFLSGPCFEEENEGASGLELLQGVFFGGEAGLLCVCVCVMLGNVFYLLVNLE
jgi:hypothetical protein